MEQTAQETLTAQISVESNGGITSHEGIAGNHQVTRQEGTASLQLPSAQ